MANYKIYSVTKDHSCDYGLDFFNGVAFTSDNGVADRCKEKGYYVEQVSDTALTQIDKLSTDVIKQILTDKSVVVPSTGMTKREYALALNASIDAEVTDTSFTTAVTVTYAGGTDSAGTAPTESATGLGSEITVKANTFTLTGKTFKCWVDGDNIEHNVGDVIKLGASALTLTAVWETAA